MARNGIDLSKRPADDGTASGTADSTFGADEKEDSGKSGVYMERHIGLLKATGILVGQVIGTGIFITPKGVTRNIGSVGASLIVWAFCGVNNFMGSLMYAEMGGMVPQQGGEFAFVKESFGEVAAFTTIWSYAFAIRPCSFAIMGRAGTEYLLQIFFPQCKTPLVITTCGAVALVAVTVYWNCRSIHFSAKVQVFFYFGKVAALLIITIVGIVQLIRGFTQNFQPDRAFQGTITDIGSIALAVYSGYYTFGGWELLSILQEEVKNPSRNLPLAAGFGMSTVIIVYIMTNIAYFTAMTPAELIASPAVALTFAQRTMGGAAFIIPILVALSATGSNNTGCMGASRLLVRGSRDGILPRMLAMLHPDWRTPIPAIVMTALLGLIYLVAADVDTLITYVSIVSRIRVNLAFCSFFYFRWKRPDWERPIRFNIILAIFTTLMAWALFVLGFVRAPVTSVVGTIVYLSAVPVYYYSRLVASRVKCLVRIMDILTIFIQRFLFVVPQKVQ